MNAIFTMLREDEADSLRAQSLAVGEAMEQRNSLGGGFFLVASILIGLCVGVAIGSPIRGVIGGTALGVLASIAVWLIDSRRRG